MTLRAQNRRALPSPGAPVGCSGGRWCNAARLITTPPPPLELYPWHRPSLFTWSQSLVLIVLSPLDKINRVSAPPGPHLSTREMNTLRRSLAVLMRGWKYPMNIMLINTPTTLVMHMPRISSTGTKGTEIKLTHQAPVISYPTKPTSTARHGKCVWWRVAAWHYKIIKKMYLA